MNDYDTDRCEICGELFGIFDQVAEMFDPADDAESVVCHAECGLQRNYEVA